MATIISKPATLSLAYNLTKFKISSSAEIRFKLSLGATLLIDESYTPDANDEIEIDVRDIVLEQLSLSLPTTDLFIQSGIVKTFTALVDDIESTFTCIRAGVENLTETPANWLKYNWLTWQPQVKQVSSSQPEWLSYYAQATSYVKVKFYMSDGTTYITCTRNT